MSSSISEGEFVTPGEKISLSGNAGSGVSEVDGELVLRLEGAFQKEDTVS